MRLIASIRQRVARLLRLLARRLDARSTGSRLSPPELADLAKRYPGAPRHWLELVARQHPSAAADAPDIHHQHQPHATPKANFSDHADGLNRHRRKSFFADFLRAPVRPKSDEPTFGVPTGDAHTGGASPINGIKPLPSKWPALPPFEPMQSPPRSFDSRFPTPPSRGDRLADFPTPASANSSRVSSDKDERWPALPPSFPVDVPDSAPWNELLLKLEQEVGRWSE